MIRGTFSPMLDSFSLRSKQIIFAARIKAGERGANTIEIDDLLVGLVLEDQRMLEKGLYPNLPEGPFISSIKMCCIFRFSHQRKRMIFLRK